MSDTAMKMKRALQAADKIDPTSRLAWQSRIISVGDDWYTTQPSVREWLLRDGRSIESRGWLPAAKAGLLIAAGGVGKTMALMQLAISKAKGGAWLNTFDAGKPGKVMALLGEEEAEEARRRLYGAHGGLGTPPTDGMIEILPMAGAECAFLMRDERGGSVETPFATELREYLKATGPWALIIAEPISRTGGPDVEIDSAAATRLVQVYESLVEATGATVLAAHHTNKIGRNGGSVDANSSRGSSALTDGFRWVASLSARKTDALGEVVTLEVVKSNYSFKGDPLLLRRADNGRLEPLSGEQRSQVEADVSGETDRQRRATQRDEEREAVRTRREERDAAKRAQRYQEKDEAKRSKQRSEERALVSILRQRPGIHTDELRAALSAAVSGCTRDRMREVLVRLGPAVVTYTPEKAPANARAYRLEESLLPEGLR